MTVGWITRRLGSVHLLADRGARPADPRPALQDRFDLPDRPFENKQIAASLRDSVSRLKLEIHINHALAIGYAEG